MHLLNQVVYISATPAEYELQEAEGVVVEQLIRPTGILRSGDRSEALHQSGR